LKEALKETQLTGPVWDRWNAILEIARREVKR
jgi:hypothetical protein